MKNIDWEDGMNFAIVTDIAVRQCATEFEAGLLRVACITGGVNCEFVTRKSLSDSLHRFTIEVTPFKTGGFVSDSQLATALEHSEKAESLRKQLGCTPETPWVEVASRAFDQKYVNIRRRGEMKALRDELVLTKEKANTAIGRNAVLVAENVSLKIARNDLMAELNNHGEELESAAEALRGLACYCGFDEDFKPADVATEALNTLKYLQFNEEWDGVAPLRVGHIVEGGTVVTVGRCSAAIHGDSLFSLPITDIKPVVKLPAIPWDVLPDWIKLIVVDEMGEPKTDDGVPVLIKLDLTGVTLPVRIERPTK